MEGESKELSSAILTALRTKLGGTIILPRDEEYATARRVWNAAIDRRPAANRSSQCLGKFLGNCEYRIE
jgi:hypothetical protein